VVEYSLKNWQLTAELVGLKVILGVVKVGNQFEYIFTEVIPTVLGTFIAFHVVAFDNFANYTSTVFSNLTGNIVNIFSNLKGLISGKTKWSDVWKPLTKGFEEEVLQWPGIAEREKGEFEKALEGEIGSVEDQWTKGLGEHLVKREKEAADAGQSVVDAIKGIFTTPDKIDPPEIGKPKPLVPTLSTDNLTLAITPEIKKAKAIRIGSAEDQLLRYGGPNVSALAALAAPPKANAVAGGIAKPAAPYVAPVTSPAKGMEEFWSGMKGEWKAQTDWLRRIETNTRTPMFATADF
jgi:hypothetical protein